ncbi:SRPBCC family protein [Jiella pelagia]|uniref:SRPBCC family protein n=1 Tax=Jiella pelagia TaxID=2986949 RepID=A0ABY7C7K8_9HYPH|nr:SRPBCC family protein [Jiella pelagia]WAP70795.1 SRPBCC family protein [Jiella pelagia]
MFRKLAAFVVALLILPGLAAAHGPTRQKASETITIDAAPDKVWAVIENFGDMSWHPRIAMADAPKGNEKGSVRTLGFTTGGMMEEELSKYDAEKMTYSTFIGHVNTDLLPATNYSATITVKPAEGGAKSDVTWRAAFYRGYPNNEPPAELNDEAAVTGVSAFITEGLENLKKTVESGS